MDDRRVSDEAEELLKKIREGTLTVNQARKQIGLTPLTDTSQDNCN
ncbi:hypothetical protein [Brevibacillus porteri]